MGRVGVGGQRVIIHVLVGVYIFWGVVEVYPSDFNGFLILENVVEVEVYPSNLNGKSVIEVWQRCGRSLIGLYIWVDLYHIFGGVVEVYSSNLYWKSVVEVW